MLSAFSPDEIDQLQRAAQMFEMILDTGAPSDEAYETLKDVYTKLELPDEYRRVTARFADYLLARDERERGIAQLVELAERHPDEPEWRERLAELGAPLVADDAPSAETDEPTADRATADDDADEASDIERAIGEAETILSELDQPGTEAAADAYEASGDETSGDETSSDEPDGVETAAELGEDAAAAGERPPSERVIPAAAAHMGGDIEREFHRSLRLGEMMVERGVITRENLETALEQQRERGKQIGQILIDLGYATETDVLNCLALQAGVPYLPLALYEVQPELAAFLPEAFARKHRLVPVDAIASTVLITIAAPLSAQAKTELESLLGERKANYYISEQSEIEKKLDELYPHAEAPSRGGGEG